MSKDGLVRRILKKGYKVSVDDGSDLVLIKSHSLPEVKGAMLGKKDLLWIYDRQGNKLGWMQVNSPVGKVLDYSTRDKRISDLVAEEFIG